MPVTYANRRATCVFFMETDHHTCASLSVTFQCLTIREPGGAGAFSIGPDRVSFTKKRCGVPPAHASEANNCSWPKPNSSSVSTNGAESG